MRSHVACGLASGSSASRADADYHRYSGASGAVSVPPDAVGSLANSPFRIGRRHSSAPTGTPDGRASWPLSASSGADADDHRLERDRPVGPDRRGRSSPCRWPSRSSSRRRPIRSGRNHSPPAITAHDTMHRKKLMTTISAGARFPDTPRLHPHLMRPCVARGFAFTMPAPHHSPCRRG